MSEFGERMPPSLFELVRLRENEIERMRDDIYLEAHLFHDHHLDESLTNSPEDQIKLLHLEHEFLREKKQKVIENGVERDQNMGDLFALAIQEKYLDKIHVVELGRTENPGENGEVDGLKIQYRQFRDWLIMQGHIKEDLSRENSGRTIRVRKPVMLEASDKLAIVERDRPLINTVIDVRGEKVAVKIGKRMVFSIPLPTIGGIYHAHDRQLNSEEALRAVENLLDHTRDCIHPIATSYHLKTYVLKD